MSSFVDGRAPGRMAVEWSEDRENIFADGSGASVDEDVREFRAAILERWAAEYAQRRTDGSDPEHALCDLRRWAHAYFQPDEAGEQVGDQTGDEEAAPQLAPRRAAAGGGTPAR